MFLSKGGMYSVKFDYAMGIPLYCVMFFGTLLFKTTSFLTAKQYFQYKDAMPARHGLLAVQSATGQGGRDSPETR